VRTLQALLFALAAASLSGCYTEYSARPTHCQARWVPGHYDTWGRWRGGHWRCG
jgi:hypothetical protein